MKQMMKLIGIIAIAAIVVFGFAACGDGGGRGGGSPCTADCKKVGDAGESTGGIIIYHNHAGFTVKGYGNSGDTGYFATFTAYYLEAAHSLMEKTETSWCTCDPDCNVTGTGTAIGTGKANTAAILAHTSHSTDTAANNAAKSTQTTFNGKNDWFLPSKDELNEMYKAKKHLGTLSEYYWSSSQFDFNLGAWYQAFNWNNQSMSAKKSKESVRAIRAINTLTFN